jgi:hypothetical protein
MPAFPPEKTVLPTHRNIDSILSSCLFVNEEIQRNFPILKKTSSFFDQKRQPFSTSAFGKAQAENNVDSVNTVIAIPHIL